MSKVIAHNCICEMIEIQVWYSWENENLTITTLMERIKPVFTEKYEFEYGDVSSSATIWRARVIKNSMQWIKPHFQKSSILPRVKIFWLKPWSKKPNRSYGTIWVWTSEFSGTNSTAWHFQANKNTTQGK